MKRFILVLAQIGSLVMIPVNIYDGWRSGSIWHLLAGCVFWLAMFYVFGFVDDSIREGKSP